MPNLLVTIRYDGSAFHGWQMQKNAYTVQEAFRKAAEKVFGPVQGLHGCSRTDAGVHANAYFVNFHTERTIAPAKAVLALNTYLPKEIAASRCVIVEEAFHARYCCTAKQYVYEIYNAPVRDPFLERYTYHYRPTLDTRLLHREAQAFVGTHDFAAFCSAGSKVVDTVRTVHAASVCRDGDRVLFTVEADGFLYNMVRIMAGSLLAVAQGRIQPGTMADVIASRDRKRAGKTAPPQGLYLNHVFYKEGDVNGRE